MNDTNLSPSVPPPVHSSFPINVPLGEHPDDRLPLAGPLAIVEAILRQPRRMIFHLRQGKGSRIVSCLLMAVVVCALGYGLVVGTFSGGTQLWVAPLKVAGGLVVAALICLPSLYIFSCLSGSQARFMEVAGLVSGLLALTTILLVGFAPVAWVFSQSTSSVGTTGIMHLLFWTVATFFGWRFLRNGFAHLHLSSRGSLYVWMILFVLVCLQMTTALRPILGTSDTFFPREKKFFAAHWVDVLEKSGQTAAVQPRN